MKNRIEEEDNIDDMPELEDFSEELNKLTGKNRNKGDIDSEIKVNVIGDKNIENTSKNVNVNVNNNTSSETKKEEGFKFRRGFFLRDENEDKNSNSSKQANSDKKENIVDLTHIKSQNISKKDKIAEQVKKEIEVNTQENPVNNIINKKDEWLNQDLFMKLAQKPNLLKYFMDPKFTEAIQLMQKDPQKAMSLYGGNPEFNEFMKEFSTIMAEHFFKLGDKEASQSITSSNDIEIDTILKDPKVTQFLKRLQTEGKLDVNELQKDEILAKKVNILIDKGFLKVQKDI